MNIPEKVRTGVLTCTKSNHGSTTPYVGGWTWTRCKTGQGTSAWHAWLCHGYYNETGDNDNQRGPLASMYAGEQQTMRQGRASPVWSDPRFVYHGLASPWSIKEMRDQEWAGNKLAQIANTCNCTEHYTWFILMESRCSTRKPWSLQ
jgi:hypothetical protein